jgi:hypothetical protein
LFAQLQTLNARRKAFNAPENAYLRDEVRGAQLLQLDWEGMAQEAGLLKADSFSLL